MKGMHDVGVNNLATGNIAQACHLRYLRKVCFDYIFNFQDFISHRDQETATKQQDTNFEGKYVISK